MTLELRVRELVRDLRPVRPIPRLRWMLALLGLAWALAVLVHWLLGAPPLLLEPGAWRAPGFLAVFSGLALAAGGALVGALARGVPGRGRAARAGQRWAAAGLGLALAAGLWMWATSLAQTPLPWTAHLGCVARSCALGVLPAALAGVLLARMGGLVSPAAAPLAAGGAAALGALAVHASCSAVDAVHYLMGHAAGPVAVALGLALPLAGWLSRRAGA